MGTEHPLSLINGDTWTFGDEPVTYAKTDTDTEAPRLLDELARFYSWLVERTDDLDAMEAQYDDFAPEAALLNEVKEHFQPVLRAAARAVCRHGGR